MQNTNTGRTRGASRTNAVLNELSRYEARNITFFDRARSWPIVWEKASGVHVWDADGRKYLDLTAAFGVANAGHANAQVVRAGQRQLAKLAHAMGDVHPHQGKADLARELSRITFERWKGGATGKTIFCNSGFEAVEAALKTAILATGKAGVIAFTGGYHGLGYGALNATHRMYFRTPFIPQLKTFAHFASFPACGQTDKSLAECQRLLDTKPIGAVLVEPIQGRAGIRVPPQDFLPGLRKLCDQHDALLVADEIFTGFGRTGRMFACEHSSTIPDLICLGKALTGGFPLSACVGKAALMDRAWPPSHGEALHTSTFLGNPVGCAMALAQIREIQKGKLSQRAASLGRKLQEMLGSVEADGLKLEVRGMGLMVGLAITKDGYWPATREVWGIVTQMLRAGFIVLPEGEHGNVISFTPPLTITEAQLKSAIRALRGIVGRL